MATFTTTITEESPFAEFYDEYCRVLKEIDEAQQKPGSLDFIAQRLGYMQTTIDYLRHIIGLLILKERNKTDDH